MGMFNKAIELAQNNKILNNKYLNYKDATVIGSTAAGGYLANKANGGDTPTAVGGGGMGFAAGLAIVGYKGSLRGVATQMTMGALGGAIAGGSDPNADWKTWAIAGAGLGAGMPGLTKRVNLNSVGREPGNRKFYSGLALGAGGILGMGAGAVYGMTNDDVGVISGSAVGSKIGSLAALIPARYY